MDSLERQLSNIDHECVKLIVVDESSVWKVTLLISLN